ncbi:MarR family winged helix-turn-helix transcriptional regulator [Enterococcus thailandicus]|uniref:MarR family transcriptional regulator n=1 Tax=Enterococcus thailandicus TaxID=417368 RepID=A0A179EPV1_ENTTH|nr:MarR family winged helix-turn-helix transcriptional regulator [Enterococcus thailandicus]MDT2750957.1 MarR family winged helix-turn-helix transcriptional regulator [Enterococcus thailandicus]MDT2775716.1 MarR family winged helix-turn-helix transcriptional regulator [Enterococcus thailandicus]MDT2794578.1 MarR family winged helix-turn-helix transcriptional regulator [Enterococcus thailandicus]OAQ54853.1 MarR family transcriptional regulator [Enterococcus thailandicus]
MDTGYLLMNISKQLKYNLNQVLNKKGITVQQWAVIQQLSLKDERTAVLLSEALDMDKPTISGIIKRLEKKGLVIKTENPSDLRSQLISLTDSGHEILGECQAISEQILANYLTVLSTDEQTTLNVLLTKINQENNQIEKRNV